jgi:DNA repair/transcription protein MET18/MMS19
MAVVRILPILLRPLACFPAGRDTQVPKVVELVEALVQFLVAPRTLASSPWPEVVTIAETPAITRQSDVSKSDALRVNDPKMATNTVQALAAASPELLLAAAQPHHRKSSLTSPTALATARSSNVSTPTAASAARASTYSAPTTPEAETEAFESRRAAIAAAQTVGALVNKSSAVGSIDRSAALKMAASASEQCLSALADTTAALPFATSTVVRHQRAVLSLSWLCKGLALRLDVAANRCLDVLVQIACPSSASADPAAEVSQDRHKLAALAGKGLAWLAMDALPGQPMHKDAGATISGIYKQKYFQLLLERHKAMQDRAVQLRRMAADDASGLQTNASASVSRDLALPLALCGMAAQLPLPALLAHAEALLPIVTSALEAAAAPPPARAAVPSLNSPGEPVSSSSAAVAATPGEGEQDKDIVSALACLRLLTVHCHGAVAARLHVLVPLLLRIAQFHTARQSLALRVAAVDVLRGFTALPYPKLHPLRSAILKGLTPCLDDPKRKVRQHAVACRNDFAVLGS